MVSRSIWFTNIDFSPDDDYHKVAATFGYDVLHAALIAVELLSPEKWGVHDDGRIMQVNSLALTSPRAVRALANIGNTHASTLAYLKSLPAFCLSNATAELAKSLGFDVRDAASKTAGDLGRFIAKQEVVSPVLFPCGNQRRDELPDTLRSAGLEVLEVVTYQSQALDANAAGHLVHSIMAAKPEVCVLFSPSGARELARLFDSRFISTMKVVAIGPTTASEMKKLGLNCAHVCEAPNADSLRVVLS